MSEENWFGNLVNQLTSKDKLELLKETFRKQLEDNIKAERVFCLKNSGVVPQFTDTKKKEVLGYLKKCKSTYEIAALDEILFFHRRLPDNFHEVEVYAENIKNSALTDERKDLGVRFN